MELQSGARTGQDDSEMCCIRQVTLSCLGHALQYKLWERTPQFFVEVTFAEDRCLLEVGQGFARAAKVFDLFVSGTVTPCTASCILEDLAVADAENAG